MDIIRRERANGTTDGYQIERSTKHGQQVLYLETREHLQGLRVALSLMLGFNRLVEEGKCSPAEAHAVLDRHSIDKTCSRCAFEYVHCRECTFVHSTVNERYYFLELLKERGTPPGAEDVRQFAQRLDQAHQTDPLCDYCKFRHQACRLCLDATESPLERDTLLALLAHVSFRERLQAQVRIRRDGTRYSWPQAVDKDTILTIPDFFYSVGDRGLCVYADGLTYHYDDRSQIHRDRNIDGRLQDLGYRVRRFTTDQVRSDPKEVGWQVRESVQEMERAMQGQVGA